MSEVRSREQLRWCIIMGIKITGKWSYKSGKTTFESKKSIVDRLFTAVHTKMDEMSPTGAASSSSAAAAAPATTTDVDFEYIDESAHTVVAVPMSSTIADMVAAGLADLDDDGTGGLYNIEVKLTKPGMVHASIIINDGDETALALGVRGCWVVRVFASFSRFCVSCFLLPLCGVKLDRPSGAMLC